jgi:hypothetical protein
MTQEENFIKEVRTKEDGRYLIYYDFTPSSLEIETKEKNTTERK